MGSTEPKSISSRQHEHESLLSSDSKFQLKLVLWNTQQDTKNNLELRTALKVQLKVLGVPRGNII